MPVEITMPKLTDSMEEGRIVEWKVAEGDQVDEGQVLAEIETDKAVMELESFWAGTVAEIVHGNGDVVPVGEAIARISEAGEEGRREQVSPEASQKPRPAPEPKNAEDAREDRQPGREPEKEPEAAGSGGRASGEEREGARRPPTTRVSASPRARKIARERGLDLERVRGSGPHGRVTVEDVEAAEPGTGDGREKRSVRPAGDGGARRAEPAARVLAAAKGVDLETLSGTGLGGRITVADVLSSVSPGSGGKDAAPPPAERGGEDLPKVEFRPEEADVEEVSFYQKAAIRRVVASKRAVPHFYLTKAVRADRLRERARAEKEGSGATLTHYLMRACALALERCPEANRSYDRGRWIKWKVIHLGLAVQTDAGLVVAVLKDAGGKDVVWLAGKTGELVDRARRGKLRPAERTNPTFTISNLGAYDVESFSAIINPPSAMTLAVGSASPAPVVTHDGQVEAGNVLHLTLSCDHRVVDGVLAARFLGEVKRLLEEPSSL